MTDVRDILDALAAVQMTIVNPDGEAVAWAGSYFEMMVSQHDMPFFSNQLTGGPVMVAAAGILQGVRDVVKMRLVLQSYALGESFEHNEQYVLGWRDAVIDTIGQHLRLGGQLAQILKAEITNWDIEVAELGSSEFWCLRFDLTIDERLSVAIGA